MPKSNAVHVRVGEESLPTYLPARPDRNPMFLESRVYQGSSGRVYPLPFTDRIAEEKTLRRWRVIWIENEYLRVMILPEVGGRIHAVQDQTNGYDLLYRQHVIKPALVGLAGPWISGGIEFNWPQHHRPATFLPVDFAVEEHPDGSRTVWLSDHDPMARMKGMHGVCLHPGRADLELKVRVYNRTPWVQTFLWWANVAVRVHEGYQSFFPPDVTHVADHAKRATSEYPLCTGSYYGVNYGARARAGVPPAERPTAFVPPWARPASRASRSASPVPAYPPHDLSWYGNIPTPCSYMAMGSHEDFFGGYDHLRQAGIVHLANHHIAPGKKQWTWGNHEFGYAWDRNLTDTDGPYIEIMAGVYTDNQPDFSFLQPGETRTWSQHWYPIQRIGPAQHATLAAAASLGVRGRTVRVGVSASRRFPRAQVILEGRGRVVGRWRMDLAPGRPFVQTRRLPRGLRETDLRLRLVDATGSERLAYQPKPRVRGAVPPPATEPPAPAAMASADELFVTGLHLEQYRHATRCPTLYWREALRRDPGDARCNNALGLWHLRRGELAEAEAGFRRAIERLTQRNPNPGDGEPYYNLGLCLRYQLDADPAPGTGAADPRFEAAYAAFYKATWNQAWVAAGYHALAEMDCRRGDWARALDHLERSLRFNMDDLRARDLQVIVLRRLGRVQEADALLRSTRALDPLDVWARDLAGEPFTSDDQTRLDLSHDYARAGLYAEAIRLLEAVPAAAAPTAEALPTLSWGAAPLVHYTLGWLHARAGRSRAALAAGRRAARQSPDYCFPARLEEIAVLQSALRLNPADARAVSYLGNLLYDRRRHEEALALWERSARLDPRHAVVWRNLGIGRFNILHRPREARIAYDRACRVDPGDARLFYERDQLWKRLGEAPARRLRRLERRLDLVRQRDDLSVELCALYNQTGQHAKALALVSSRKFQPWEGGEGQALSQHVRTHLALGRLALAGGNPAGARAHFEAALAAPENLGEAKHLLANQSDIHFWMGEALQALGDRAGAKRHWRAAATFQGDFQTMRVRAFSERTYYSALAWERLGLQARGKRLLRDLLRYARQLAQAPATIDYFATSLPTMLLFHDDLRQRQVTTALFLEAQARLGLGQRDRAKRGLRAVLRRDPGHALAADLWEELTAPRSGSRAGSSGGRRSRRSKRRPARGSR